MTNCLLDLSLPLSVCLSVCLSVVDSSSWQEESVAHVPSTSTCVNSSLATHNSFSKGTYLEKSELLQESASHTIVSVDL